jgi:hypothetical protein
MKDDLEAQSPDQKLILDTIVSNHVYVAPDLDIDYATDGDGKLKTHQTLRRDGFTTYYTGRGDDTTDPDNYGDGVSMVADHKIGDPVDNIIYVDFNCVNNRSYLYEGYISYDGAKLDCISMEVVPRLVTGAVSTNTNYNLYGGYMVIPAAGDGTFSLTSDITDSDGGLVYMPLHEDGSRSSGFWNAEWDNTTKKFINITAAPMGDGHYNMFTVEVVLNRFINELHFTGMGTQQLDSEDVNELGHGLRVRLTTKTHGTDHDWNFTASFTMHRELTV